MPLWFQQGHNRIVVAQQIIIDGIHLLLRLVAVITLTLLDKINGNTSQNKSTNRNHSGMFAVLNRGEVPVRVFFSANKFKTFAETCGKIFPVIKATGLHANPAVLVAFRCGRRVQ